MRWQDRPESDNVEDMRDEAGPQGGFGGGGGGLPFPLPTGEGGGIGLIGVLVIVGIALFLGVDPRVILSGGQGGGVELPGGGNRVPMPRDRAARTVTAEDDSLKRFSSIILKDTEIIWTKLFQDQGLRYTPPKLVLYRGGVQSGCGLASSQMGPFYCPVNRKLYVDLSFYEELKNRFSAPGDFAQAYVIAHEVGHHIQNLLGRLTSAQSMQQAASSTRERNSIQVKVELQADCYAGVWAKTTSQINGLLEPGDIEQGLRAASAIGDDALQRQATGRVVPDSFTHGSSAQRVSWFKRGYDTGAIANCDTFNDGRT